MGCRGVVSHNVGATPTPLELYVLYVNLWIHIYYPVTYYTRIFSLFREKFIAQVVIYFIISVHCYMSVNR